MPSIVELLLKEFDTEMKGTQRALEQAPEGKYDWKPHPKSMELGYLASLVATMPGWLVSMINEPSLDLAAGSRPDRWTTRAELLKQFEGARDAGRKALAATNDTHLLTTRWKLMMKDQVLGDDLRYDAVRVGMLNHLWHHRAQLGIYTRLNEGKVPGLYGPSADEPWGAKG
ncbi:MAG TPA: DinB family protein [Gemmatimonadales bacterium]|nr:DinB family protein [Gemmatimonadales bacterium]